MSYQKLNINDDPNLEISERKHLQKQYPNQMSSQAEKNQALALESLEKGFGHQIKDLSKQTPQKYMETGELAEAPQTGRSEEGLLTKKKQQVGFKAMLSEVQHSITKSIVKSEKMSNANLSQLSPNKQVEFNEVKRGHVNENDYRFQNKDDKQLRKKSKTIGQQGHDEVDLLSQIIDDETESLQKYQNNFQQVYHPKNPQSFHNSGANSKNNCQNGQVDFAQSQIKSKSEINPEVNLGNNKNKRNSLLVPNHEHQYAFFGQNHKKSHNNSIINNPLHSLGMPPHGSSKQLQKRGSERGITVQDINQDQIKNENFDKASLNSKMSQQSCAINNKMSLSKQIKMTVKNTRENPTDQEKLNKIGQSFYRNSNGVPKEKPALGLTPIKDMIEDQKIDINLSDYSGEQDLGKPDQLIAHEENVVERRGSYRSFQNHIQTQEYFNNTKMMTLREQEDMIRLKSIKSAVSQITYNSNETFQNQQIDEQVENHRQMIKQLIEQKQSDQQKLITGIQEHYPEFSEMENRERALSAFSASSHNFKISRLNEQKETKDTDNKQLPVAKIVQPGHKMKIKNIDRIQVKLIQDLKVFTKPEDDEPVKQSISYSQNQSLNQDCDKSFSQSIHRSKKSINIEQIDISPSNLHKTSLVGNNNINTELQIYMTGFKAPVIKNLQSKQSEIKKDKKNGADTETLIRRFNLKRFDEVIKGLKAQSKAIIRPSITEEEMEANLMGVFLFITSGCDKEVKGYYFGQDKKKNILACTAFLRQFSFKNLQVLTCWRRIFSKTGLPKEGQQIVRVLEIFQQVYLEQNINDTDIQGYPQDVVWTLSVKLLDLNKSLHDSRIQASLKQTKELFVKSCLSLLKGAYSKKQLEEIYINVQSNEFEFKMNINERQYGRINEMLFNIVMDDFDSSIKSQNSSIQKKNLARSLNSKFQSQYNFNEVFKTVGTKFIKYCRKSKPKRRLVYLSQDETQIFWKEIDSKQKPRAILVKDLETVIIGSDQTQVMRKEQIQAHLDNQCISLIGKHRTLDLMHPSDPQIVQLWATKIRQLIDKVQKHDDQNPDQFENLSKQEFNIRDQVPISLQYLWQNEILNNWQKYWNPTDHAIIFSMEIQINSPDFKNAVIMEFEKTGGFFLTFSHEATEEQLQLDQNLRPVSQIQGLRQKSIVNKVTFAGCLPITQRSSTIVDIPNTPQPKSRLTKIFNIFNKKDQPFTLDQLWYRGLPNLARYCIWPILIGNNLHIDKWAFDSFKIQRQIMQRQMTQLKQVERQNQELRQKQRGHSRDNSSNQLSLIISEGRKEIFMEDNGSNTNFDIPLRSNVMSSAEKSLALATRLSDIPNVFLDSYSKEMIKQFYRIERKVDKLSIHWEKAAIIGPLAGIDTKYFETVMNDVLCIYLVNKASSHGIQAMANLMDLQEKQFNNLGQASFVSGLEKILAPLVLVHMREKELDPEILNKISYEVYVCFNNLLMPSNQSCQSMKFLYHFINDDLSEIEWRMDFFEKLFVKVLPILYQQFQGINLKSEFFLHGWMMTMFMKVQGLEGIEFSLRIWDLYLLHGEPILYCFALVILKTKWYELTNAPLKTWLDFFYQIKKLKLPCQAHISYLENNLKMSQVINNDSSTLIQMCRDAVSILFEYNVPLLFRMHEQQQLIAEQKNEVFTKIFFDNDI